MSDDLGEAKADGQREDQENQNEDEYMDDARQDEEAEVDGRRGDQESQGDDESIYGARQDEEYEKMEGLQATVTQEHEQQNRERKLQQVSQDPNPPIRTVEQIPQ